MDSTSIIDFIMSRRYDSRTISAISLKYLVIPSMPLSVPSLEMLSKPTTQVTRIYTALILLSKSKTNARNGNVRPQLECAPISKNLLSSRRTATATRDTKWLGVKGGVKRGGF